MSMVEFTKHENKLHVDTGDKTVGMLIINLTSSMGGLGKTIEKVKEGKKDNTNLLKDILKVQKQSSLLFNKLKNDLKLSTDESYYNLLKNNYSSLKRNFQGMKQVWYFFRLLQYLGELNEKFHIRTQQHEYQFLMKSLNEFQTYLTMYIESAVLDAKARLIVTKDKIEIVDEKSKSIGIKVKKEESTPKGKGEDKTVNQSKTKKGKSKKGETKKKNGKDEIKKVTKEYEKPPLPDSGLIKDLVDKFIPRNDEQKVEKLSEEEKQRIINGDI